MKTLFCRIQLFLLICITAGFTSCTNEDDDDFFRSEGASISGTVLYRNYFTNQLDTATNAEVTVINEDTKNKYFIQAEHGKFKVDFLRKESRIINIDYVTHSTGDAAIVYTYKDTLKSLDIDTVFVLEASLSQDYALGSVSGRILFDDELSDLNKIAPDIEVRLRSSSTYAVFTDSTDESGYFTINNLADGSYDLDVTYYQNTGSNEPLVYKLISEQQSDTLISVRKNNDTPIGNRTLKLNTKNLVNSFIKVKVSASNARVANAKVYLFNYSIDAAPDLSTAIDSTETNQRGIAIFGDLEGSSDDDSISYYVHSSAIIDDDDLVNNTTVLIGNSPDLVETELRLMPD